MKLTRVATAGVAVASAILGSHVAAAGKKVAPGAGLVSTRTSTEDRIAWIDLEGRREVALRVRADVRAGDTVKVRAELGCTNDVRTADVQPGAVIYKSEVRYPLHVTGALRLAGGGVFGRGDVTISPENHHGLLSVKGKLVVRSGDPKLDEFRLVVRANVPGASRAPVNAIARDYEGFVDPPGWRCLTRVDDRKGRIDVLVLRERWNTLWSRETLESRVPDVKASFLVLGEKKVAISLPLGRVRAGEVFDAESRLRVIARGSLPQLCSGQLFLADSPTAIQGQQCSTHHGFNVPPGQTFTLTKMGAFTAKEDHARAWLNLVVNSMDPDIPPRRLDIVAGESRITVVRYVPTR